jgi:hypothetical protein
VARPDLAAMVAAALPGCVVVLAALPDSVVHRKGNIAAVDIQAVRAQLATAQPFDRDYPGHIASHSRVVVPMALAPARVVVVLRLPLSHSIF